MANIYRRGRIWWARGQRGGKEFRKSLQTTDRRTAERRYREWLDRLEASSWGERARHTFQEATGRFITEHCAALKPASAKRYSVSLKALAETFWSLYLDQITRAKLADYETWRRTTGVSNSTIRRDFACLSSLMTSCEDWDWIPEGANLVPAYMKRRAKRGLREAPERRRYLTEAEEARLLEHASPSVRRAIEVAIDTGLRKEEQLSLTWPQIDRSRGMIQTTSNTKSGRKRSVPLPQRAAHNLAQIARQPMVGRVASLFVFRHDDGRRLVTMEKGMKAAARRAGIKDLRWHDLRRTAGCRWLQRDGRSMEEVCILLGHSSVAVTEKRYAFLENEAVAQSVAQKPDHGLTDYSRSANE